MSDAELDRVKCIDLREVAASMGYFIDKRESWRSGTVMRHDSGDKVIISRQSNHWVYYSIRSNQDNGTVIDFLQRRTGKNLGEIRKELRVWSGESSYNVPAVEECHKDIARLQYRWAKMQIAKRNAYLEKERGIPAVIFGEWWRMAGKVKNDVHGNACFMHVNRDGVCGYEIRGPHFKGFAKGGEKGLAVTKIGANDNTLVVCESALEFISYATLYSSGPTTYASTAGQISAAQEELLVALIRRMPKHGSIIPPVADEFVSAKAVTARKEPLTVIAAMNPDKAGRQMAERIKACVEKSCVAEITYERREPLEHEDWNAALLDSKRPSVVFMRTMVPR